jgi:exopolysaccharide biosynthesis WecB/TagA/CpsF family protein
LVGRGSPIQEIWTENNRVKIQEMECLVFTVGGLLDFWAGIEKRAPVWMRTAKIEWLYRAISNPKKNLKKTLVSLQLLRYLISK